MRMAVLACLAAAAAASRDDSLHSAPLATHRMRHNQKSVLLRGTSGDAVAGDGGAAAAATASTVPDSVTSADHAAILAASPAAVHDAAVPAAIAPTPARALVIVVGQLRGGEAAWRSMQRHLLTPLNADLATFFSDATGGTLIQGMAKFNWTCPGDNDDWSSALDDIAASCGRTRADWLAAFCTTRLDNQQWLGGATPECKQQSSAGMLMVYRWLLQQKITELGLDSVYDHFVVTRADHMYLCDHVPIDTLDRNTLYVAEGENYGGWSDRHVLGHRDVFLRGLNMTFEMFCNPRKYAAVIEYHLNAGMAANGGTVNIETLQKIMWQALEVPVATVLRPMFIVRAEGDPTKWSQGVEHASFAAYGLKIKYPDELAGARATCAAVNGGDLDAKLQSLYG